MTCLSERLLKSVFPSFNLALKIVKISEIWKKNLFFFRKKYWFYQSKALTVIDFNCINDFIRILNSNHDLF